MSTTSEHWTRRTFFLAGSSCSPSWKPATSKLRVTGLGFAADDSVGSRAVGGGVSTSGWICTGMDDVVGGGLPPKLDGRVEAANADACMNGAF